MTVTVNEQLAAPVVVQLTVVKPSGKKEPLVGLQVTAPQPPLDVGPVKLTTAPH